MLRGNDDGGEDLYVTIPLGGPIYAANVVGPLTRVPDFENCAYQELQSLKEELCGETTEMCDEDISVDELKIIREEELVSKAFEEAFKHGELAIESSEVREECLSPRADDYSASGHEHGCSQNLEGDMMAIVPSESSTAVPLKTVKNKKLNKKSSGKKKKRKRDTKKNLSFDESYMSKVEELAKIKQKQEEDKAAVRLHSFKAPGCGANSRADKIKSLKSGSVSTKVRASNIGDHVPVQFPEAVLSFEVYHNRKTWAKEFGFLPLLLKL